MRGTTLGMALAVAMGTLGGAFKRAPRLPKRGIARYQSFSKKGRQLAVGYLKRKDYGGRFTGQAKSRRAAKKRNNIRKHN